jgi:hypothetical protein
MRFEIFGRLDGIWTGWVKRKFSGAGQKIPHPRIEWGILNIG